MNLALFFFASRRPHTSSLRDWSSDVCSSDLGVGLERADDRNRARGHEGRDREAPDDELPKHDTADDGQDRWKIVDEGIERSEERRVGKEWSSRRPRYC